MLLCAIDGAIGALPLTHILETMRPLPIEPVPAAPSSVRGAAVVRGRAIPVVDAGALCARAPSRDGRFVVVRAGDDRSVALLVDAVIGVRELAVEALPPLFDATSGGALDGVARIDAQLVLVLSAARLVPDHVWQMVATP
ncbi:MAG TPA: chemotaxis protein CheW [Myxococcota bacterium]